MFSDRSFLGPVTRGCGRRWSMKALKKATGKEVRRNVHKLSSPETPVWQEFGPEQPKGEVSVRDEEKRLRFEERDYISDGKLY
jgi:hypothetical protein